MGLGEKGYIFTLITALMIMVIMSLILFQTQISSPVYEDTTSKVSLDELHYYVEALKNDAERAIAISGQRASTYATNHIINTNETFSGYGMENCSEFIYYANGSEAALAELMVCGNLTNAAEDTGDIQKYMENNTVTAWMDRVNTHPPGDTPYNASIRLRNMSMAMYDSWHYMIFSNIDLNVIDPSNGNRYIGYDIPVTSIVGISSIEDPMYSVEFGVPDAIRQYEKCESHQVVNGTVLDEWIDSGCYQSGRMEYGAPSFFDRLEGRKTMSTKSLARYSDTLKALNYTITEIGVESLINLDILETNNVSVNDNLTQIDYLYWNGDISSCSVEGMEEHPEFKVDINHARDYKIQGLNCEVEVDRPDDGNKYDIFKPPKIDNLPAGTKITYVDVTDPLVWGSITRTLHYASKTRGEGEDTLVPGGKLTWFFNETGDYAITSHPNDASGPSDHSRDGLSYITII
jgi:hypothetical protein